MPMGRLAIGDCRGATGTFPVDNFRREVPVGLVLRAFRAAVAFPVLLMLLPSSCHLGAAEPDADAERIAVLIQQLGDEDYFVRERAQDDLARIGLPALDALTEAEESDDVEISARARYLVRLLRVEWTDERDSPEVRALMSGYETPDENSRLDAIDQLGRYDDGKGLATLCRLVRFEKSHVISKLAAVRILKTPRRTDADWERLGKLIPEIIGTSPRVGAEWLRAYLDLRNETDAAAEAWGKLAEAESITLARSPLQSRAEIVEALWRQRYERLQSLDRADDIAATLAKIIDLADDPARLMDTIDWMMERRVHSGIEQLATRYHEMFDADPVLLYMLASAREASGDHDRALEAARRALELDAGNVEQHVSVINTLVQRRMQRWVPDELRAVINLSPPGTFYALRCQSILSEILHDKGQDGEAGQLLDDAVKAMEANLNGGRSEANAGLEVEKIRARMHFFQSLGCSSRNERAQQIEHLQAALEEDPTDADVLIALYRLEGLEPALREKTVSLIKEAAEEFRREIDATPDDATPYNQLAWLISNTEGDKQDALRCSLKSLELRPDAAGFMDTLGRCYYAVGELENAIKAQSQAVERDPESGLMRRQLEFFIAERERLKANP